MTPSMFEGYADDEPAEVIEREPETRGTQVAMIEWLGWEQETFRK